jgi:hypothetical protein
MAQELEFEERYTSFATFNDTTVKRSIAVFCDVDVWGPGRPSPLGTALEMEGFIP